MTKTDDIQWFEPSRNCSNLPKWATRVCINSDGDLFVPAYVAGNGIQVFLWVSQDNEPIVIDNSGHFFVRADWVMQKDSDPRLKKAFKNLKQSIAKLCAQESKKRRFITNQEKCGD